MDGSGGLGGQHDADPVLAARTRRRGGAGLRAPRPGLGDPGGPRRWVRGVLEVVVPARVPSSSWWPGRRSGRLRRCAPPVASVRPWPLSTTSSPPAPSPSTARPTRWTTTSG
jgi:hypothetical protein